MADRTYDLQKQVQSKLVTNLKKSVLLEATVSTDDTITVGQLTAVTAAVVKKAVDGTAVSCTVLTNVITITEVALTNVQVVVFAIGA